MARAPKRKMVGMFFFPDDYKRQSIYSFLAFIKAKFIVTGNAVGL